jgi:Flp pilus assembly protein TadG
MSIRTKAREEDGAAAVEFALIVGLLAILIFGLLEYGIAFWQVQNLRAATREGARVAAVGGDRAEIMDAMENSSAGSITGGETFLTTPGGDPPCTDDTEGGQVTVTLSNGSLTPAVREAFEVSIPFLPPISLNPTLSGTFRCE